MSKEPTDCERLLEWAERMGPVGIHSHDARKHGFSGNPSQRIKE